MAVLYFYLLIFSGGSVLAESARRSAPRTTAYTRTLLDDANEAEFKATTNLESGVDFQAWDTDLDWLASNLNAWWKTLLDDPNQATTQTTLGLDIGTDVQAWDDDLDDIAALTPTNSNIIVGDGTDWVAESGATARTSIGVGTGDSPTFTGLDLTGITDGYIPYVGVGALAASPLFVTAGNVGIGTTTPASPLEVEAGLTTVGAVFTLGTKETTIIANDVLGRINFYAPLEASGTDAILVGASIVAIAEAEFTASVNSTSLAFQTGASGTATTKMLIDSAGNVGIGTTTPGAGLEISSTTLPQLIIKYNVDNYLTITNQGIFDIYSPGSLNNFAWKAAGTTLMTLDASTGNVGIGTTTPNAKLDIILDSAADGTDALSMRVCANGNSAVDGIVVNYQSGALAASETGGGIRSRMDVQLAVAADATTDISAYTAVQVGAPSTDATLNAFKSLPGFTNALLVEGALPIDPSAGYEVSSGGTTETDRVNGGAGDGQAFLESSASDLTIFDADDDYILIGSAAPFELVGCNLLSGSSKSIAPTFWYTSDGAGTWSALTITADGTQGFTQSGLITFNEPIDWAADDQSPDGTAITSAYYIAIRRTYAATIPTLPVEDYFKTFESKETGMKIRGDGVVKLPYIGAAPANLENGMMWMESDGLHTYYSDGEHTLAE